MDFFDNIFRNLIQRHITILIVAICDISAESLARAKEIVLKGGMDFIMLNDFFDAVRNKKAVPLGAYDAAARSAVAALSEMSVAIRKSAIWKRSFC